MSPDELEARYHTTLLYYLNVVHACSFTRCVFDDLIRVSFTRDESDNIFYFITDWNVADVAQPSDDELRVYDAATIDAYCTGIDIQETLSRTRGPTVLSTECFEAYCMDMAGILPGYMVVVQDGDETSIKIKTATGWVTK